MHSCSTAKLVDPRFRARLRLGGFPVVEGGDACKGVNFQPNRQLKRWEMLGTECLLEPENTLLPADALIDVERPCQIPFSRLEIPG